MRVRSKLTVLAAVLPLAAVAAVPLAGARGHHSTARADHRGGTFVVLTPASPATIDPGIDYGTAWAEIILSHDGLVAFRKVAGAPGAQIVPDLAVAVPKPTANGKTYAFKLRSGIRYSDGSLLKASDFKNVFERMFKVHSPVAGSFYSTIVGAKACGATPATCDLSKGVVTNNATGTVVFHLTEASNEFLQQLALPFAFAVPGNAPNSDIGSTQLPGTGPYMWASYAPNRELRLVRNPHFKVWSAAAQPDGFPDEIDVKIGLDLEAAITQVENGQADFVLPVGGTLPNDRLNEISTKYASQTHVNPVAGIFYMAMNNRVAPFNNVLVRRAINYATDRNAIVKIFGGAKLAVPTCQVLPPAFPGYRPYCPYSKGGGGKVWKAPNMAKARKLIAQSGTKGQTVTIVNPNIPPGQATGLYYKDLLNKLGYKTKLKLLAPPVSNPLAKNSRNKIQMTFSIWFQDYPAASDFLAILASCKSFVPNSGSNPNIEEYCDRKVQAKMDRAATLGRTDPAAANRLWAEIDKNVTDAAAMVVMINPRAVTFVSKRVGNFLFNPQWQFLLDQAWVQ